jgi:hypothetical protein
MGCKLVGMMYRRSSTKLLLFCGSDFKQGRNGQCYNNLWLAEISKIFLSDTTWRMELEIAMKDHCKLLTKYCYFLDRLKILPAKFVLIWFTGFRGEDLNVIFYQNMPNLHNRYKPAERKFRYFFSQFIPFRNIMR